MAERRLSSLRALSLGPFTLKDEGSLSLLLAALDEGGGGACIQFLRLTASVPPWLRPADLGLKDSLRRLTSLHMDHIPLHRRGVLALCAGLTGQPKGVAALTHLSIIGCGLRDNEFVLLAKLIASHALPHLVGLNLLDNCVRGTRGMLSFESYGIRAGALS